MRRSVARLGGGHRRIDAQHSKGKLPARERVELFQAGVGHSDGKRLFWVGSGGLVQLVDLGTGTVERLEEPRLPARQGVHAVDGGWVLTGRRSVDVLLAGGEVRPLAEAIAPELMGVGAGRVWYTAALGEGPNDAREVRSVPVDGGPVVVHGAHLGERTDDARGQASTLWPRPFAVGADLPKSSLTEPNLCWSVLTSPVRAVSTPTSR